MLPTLCKSLRKALSGSSMGTLHLRSEVHKVMVWREAAQRPDLNWTPSQWTRTLAANVSVYSYKHLMGTNSHRHIVESFPRRGRSVTRGMPLVLEHNTQQAHLGVMFECPHTFGHVMYFMLFSTVSIHTNMNVRGHIYSCFVDMKPFVSCSCRITIVSVSVW